MAEISYREKVLLGYSPTRLSNFHASRRNSDVDFSDVFGGPPRRSMTHEYYSDGHCNKDSFDSLNDDEDQRYRGAWLEKPVFGDQVVGTRRRYQSEDNFYGDIFMGGDQQPTSCAQSPTRRDAFSSAPGSRIMSPSRPLSSMAEPFASPAKFSLPAPLANADFMASPPVNQTMNSPSFSTSRLNHTFQNHGVSRAGARSSYRPSPLSHQNSLDGKELESTKNIDGGLVEPGLTKDSKVAEVSTNNDTQFHFSIYKWAGKGVPSVMPLRRKTSIKEKTRFDRSSRTNEGVKGSSLNNHQEDMVADRNDTVSSKTEESQSLDDISPALSNAVSYNSSRNSKDEASDDVLSYDSVVPREFPNLSKRNAHIDKSNDSLKSHANTTKSYMRSLKFFFQSEENGNDIEIPKMKGNESTVNKKGQPSSDDDVPIRKINKSGASQSFREGKVDRHRSEGTNKVKDFVKIFNQEPSSKPKKHVLGRQSQSSRWDEKSVAQEENKVKSTSTEKHTKMQASKAKESKTLPKAYEVEDGNSFMSEKQQFDVKIVGSVFEAPTSASTEETGAGRDAAPNINATSESDFMNTESPQEIDMMLEVEHKEETEDCERKILQWSKGKEGNIRALLSTLQYVLWPDSGWKSVPLVDIIEANAVKRAYQRALLRLHPDKLQQKGAAMHQKFIAEKVFDILQEAWDQFNSIGPL